jgi:hypothetical protein
VAVHRLRFDANEVIMASIFSPHGFDRLAPAQRRKGKALLAALSFALLSPALLAADSKPAAGGLSAAQIVDKCIAARGGLGAWHGVQTMSWSGKLDAGGGDSVARSARYASGAMPTARARAKAEVGAQVDTAEAPKQVQLPFMLAMERPHKSRLELEFAGKTAVQVYDGTNGWKLRPFLNRNDVEPFTAQEAKIEAARADMDGPLLDYAAKGTKLGLEAVEKVDGRDAYRIKLTARDGGVQHVWIDAQSFLDVKLEGTPRRMDGHMHNVWVYQRDFRAEQGLMIPHVLETAVDGYRETHKMLIEKVTLNPRFDETLFAKPLAPRGS